MEPGEVIGEAIGDFILLVVVLALGALIGAVGMGAYMHAHPCHHQAADAP